MTEQIKKSDKIMGYDNTKIEMQFSVGGKKAFPEKKLKKHQKKGTISKLINNVLRIFYSINKTKLYILLITIFGFILRLIAANNMGLHPDDANHAVRPIGIIGSGKMVEYGQSTALWYYIQEVFYKIFGASQLGSRMASVVFGSFFVILMFIFVKQIFKSEKAGLIAAFLTAVSPFLIKMTLPEMDVTVMFFTIFSALFLFKYAENWKNKNLVLSGILIGIAILIKVYALFFAFSFFIFLIYSYNKKGELNKKTINKIIIFLLVIFIFCIPTLTHNYLLYKDKGFMDMMFTNLLKIGTEKAKELYGWGAGWMPAADYMGFFFGNKESFGSPLPGFILVLFLFKQDIILLILGLLGLILTFKKTRNYFWFFLIVFIPPFIYIGAQPAFLMHKHFTFMPLLFIPMAACFLGNIHNKIKEKFPKFGLRYLLIFILIFNLLLLGKGPGEYVYRTSAETQLIDYKIDNIPENSLVVVDSRIYRGYMVWMFHDRNYLEAGLLSKTLEEGTLIKEKITEKTKDIILPAHLSTESSSTDVYFVECVTDDCGWGTIDEQPEVNQSMEDMTEWFANGSKIVKEIDSINPGDYYLPFLTKSDVEPVYRIYKNKFMLNPLTTSAVIKSKHELLLYPVGYDESITPIFDKYETHNAIDSFINVTAHIIFYIAFLLSFFSLLYMILLFILEDETFNRNSSI